MSRRQGTGLALAAIFLAACGGSYVPREVDFKQIPVSGQWFAEAGTTYVVRTDEAWQALWMLHGRTQPVVVVVDPSTEPAFHVPTIDFGPRMVLGVSLGWGSNGCYGIAVERIVEHEQELRVEYVAYEPEPEMICTLAVVPLTTLVEVAWSEKRVSFVRKARN